MDFNYRNSYRHMDARAYAAADSPAAIRSREEMAAALNNTRPAGATIGERSKYLANQAWTRTLGGLANTFASFGGQYVTLRYTSHLPLAGFMGGTAVAAMKATVLKALEHVGPNLKLPKASEGNLYSRQELAVKIADGLLDAGCYMLAAMVSSKAKVLVQAHNSEKAFEATLLRHPDTLLAIAATSAGFDVAHYMLTAFVTACVPSAKYEVKSWNALKQAAGQNLAAGKHVLTNWGGTGEALKSNVDFVVRMGVNAAGTGWLPLSNKFSKGLEYAQAGPAKAAAGGGLRTIQGPLKDYVFKRLSDYKSRNESQQAGTSSTQARLPDSPEVRLIIQDDSAERLRDEIAITILDTSSEDRDEMNAGLSGGDDALDSVQQAIHAAAQIPLPDDDPVETPAASQPGSPMGRSAASSPSGQAVGRNENLQPAGGSRVEASSSNNPNNRLQDAEKQPRPGNDAAKPAMAHESLPHSLAESNKAPLLGNSSRRSDTPVGHFSDNELEAGGSSRVAGESSRFAGRSFRWLGNWLEAARKPPRPGNDAAQPAMAPESSRHSLRESNELSLLGESRRSHISLGLVSDDELKPGGFSPLHPNAPEPASSSQADDEPQRSQHRK